MNVTYKILQQHMVEGELTPGKEIGLRIDQTLTQDATGTMAYLQFEAMGVPRVKTELSVSYIDHNTLQQGFENADDHNYLQTVAAKYGIFFSRAGNGICHQVHLERFGKPGKTLLGSDSHTPTAGGLGMIAIGAGGLDVAVAMAGGLFYMAAPEVIRIDLTGKLRPWVSAKDVILHVLGILSTKGNVNRVLEYAGSGVKNLSVPERATIANMGAETGVTTSVFPSDEITRQFLAAQGRDQDWQPLAADEDATYHTRIKINLARVVPMVAQPHSPGNVAAVAQIAGKKVDQIEIGSCTNSSLRDLCIVGKVLAGKKVHAQTSVAVAPGSRQVFSMIAKNGVLAQMIDSGCRIMESACGFCIGLGQSPPSGAVSLRTSNRNFEGRSGTADAQVYLVSPETAALSALAGRVIDPLTQHAKEFPRVAVPRKFDIDDSMILAPAPDPDAVSITRGPNIGAPPQTAALPQSLSGVIGITVGDKITTDHIMPAGNRLKFRSNINAYAAFVFEGVDPGFAQRAANLRDQHQAVFIVAGDSYGQGSSREHAALCPRFLGVRAVIAKSFERIHAANLVNSGILPLVFSDHADYGLMAAGDEVVIEDIPAALGRGANLRLRNITKAQDVSLRYDLSARQRKIVLAGGLLRYVTPA